MPRMFKVCSVAVPGMRKVQPLLGGENVCHSDWGIVLFRSKYQRTPPPAPITSRSRTAPPATKPTIRPAEDFLRLGLFFRSGFSRTGSSSSGSMSSSNSSSRGRWLRGSADAAREDGPFCIERGGDGSSDSSLSGSLSAEADRVRGEMTALQAGQRKDLPAIVSGTLSFRLQSGQIIKELTGINSSGVGSAIESNAQRKFIALAD